MKLLILGCSHSVGAFNNSAELYNMDDGWVNNISNRYEYDVDCISHLGGGSFNYIVTVGMLKDIINSYDKIIIQYTDEPRLTFYDIDYISDFPKDLLVYNNKNLKRYVYSHKKNIGGLNNQTGNLYFHQHNLAKNFNKNSYLKTSIESHKNNLKNIFENKLYTFEWNDIKVKMNNMYGKHTYEKIVNSVDGQHLDGYGNKLIFELIEPDLNNFL